MRLLVTCYRSIGFAYNGCGEDEINSLKNTSFSFNIGDESLNYKFLIEGIVLAGIVSSK